MHHCHLSSRVTLVAAVHWLKIWWGFSLISLSSPVAAAYWSFFFWIYSWSAWSFCVVHYIWIISSASEALVSVNRKIIATLSFSRDYFPRLTAISRLKVRSVPFLVFLVFVPVLIYHLISRLNYPALIHFYYLNWLFQQYLVYLKCEFYDLTPKTSTARHNSF